MHFLPRRRVLSFRHTVNFRSDCHPNWDLVGQPAQSVSQSEHSLSPRPDSSMVYGDEVLMDRRSLPEALRDTHEVLYLISTTVKVPLGDRTVEELLSPVWESYEQYLSRLDKEQRLVSHSALLGLPGGQTTGTFMTVLRVDTLAEADTIASDDPLLLCGFVDVEVKAMASRIKAPKVA